MLRIDSPRSLGHAVAVARNAKGMTQAQLAASAGVSRQLVNRLEMGTASGIALEKVFAILGQVELTLQVGNVEDDASAGEEDHVARQAYAPAITAEGLRELYPLEASLFGPPDHDEHAR